MTDGNRAEPTFVYAIFGPKNILDLMPEAIFLYSAMMTQDNPDD